MVTSTRSNQDISVSKAILNGLAKEKGLYVFKNVKSSFFQPTYTTLTYNELAKKILTELTDFNESEIDEAIKLSYNEKTFMPEVVTLKPFDGFAFLELYNGNTFAFKDLALSMLPNLYKIAKTKNNETKRTVILTATSGDTGSAALEGFSQQEDIKVIVLYPTKGVSEFQELQMNNSSNKNCLVYAVDGNFDDCQNIVKKLLVESKLSNTTLSSANSINIGRIIPQIIYYFYSYYELVRTGQIQMNDTINITVPTGNFGNIYAAYLAKSMGVPIKNLIVASNKNNVLTDVFNKGIYKSSQSLEKTISPSMDILVSSNLERYIFDLYHQNSEKVNEIMTLFSSTKEVSLPIKNDSIFKAYYATEEQTKETIRDTFDKYNYLIDPHTAVAKYGYLQYIKETKDTTFNLIASTANPYKFSDSVLDALHLSISGNLEEKCNFLESKTNFKIDTRMKELFHKPVRKTELTLEDAYSYIKKVLGDIDAKN